MPNCRNIANSNSYLWKFREGAGKRMRWKKKEGKEESTKCWKVPSHAGCVWNMYAHSVDQLRKGI